MNHQLLSHLVGSPRFLSSGALVALTLLSGTAAAQELEYFTLSPAANVQYSAAVPNPSGPGSDWNCLDTLIAERRLRTIVPNDLSGDPARIAAMLRFTKHVSVDTALSSTGQIGAWHQDGTLFAIEYDIFPEDPVVKPTLDQRLPTDGVIQGLDETGTFGVLGRFFCYDENQYNDRIAQLTELMDGMPPHQYSVWTGPVVHSGSTGTRSMWIHGVSNHVRGDLKSNGDLRISGSDQTIDGAIMHAGELVVSGTGHVLGSELLEGALLPLMAPGEVLDYISLALGAGSYFLGDLTVVDDGNGGLASAGGQPLSGVVYASGDIVVMADDVAGQVTFVAGGGIEFSGSRNNLTAAVDDMLAFAIAGPLSRTLSVDGSENVLTGALYVRGEELWVTGDDNVIVGRARCSQLKVTGEQNLISDGTHAPTP